MIKVEGLYKSFDGQRVLEGVNLEVKKGEVMALIGRSGTGKSVLLRHMMGLVRPDAGKVFIDGLDVHRLRPAQRREIKELSLIHI